MASKRLIEDENKAGRMLSMLRKEAEKVVHKNQSGDQNNLSFSETDTRQLIQELQVHQIELEMQNDELKIVNEALEIQRIKLAGIYDLAPVGYFIVDPTGFVEEVNSMGLTLLDGSRITVLKKNFRNFIYPACFDQFYTFLKDLLTTSGSKSRELQMQGIKGKPFYAQLEGIAISDVPLTGKRCYIAVIDISERIESKKKLEETKERLELALHASNAGTWEIDTKTGMFFLDNSNHQICGLQLGEFDGRYNSFIMMIHPDDRMRVDEHLRSSMNSEKEINTEYRILKPDGNHCHVSVKGHIVHAGIINERFVGTMMDITNRKLLEEESHRLKMDQQKHITAAILKAQENERRRISEALHDSVSQLLYGIKLKLDTNGGDFSSGKSLNSIQSLLDQAISETRNISFELAPSILTDFGLPTTIKEIAKRLSTSKLHIRTTVTGFSKRLSPEMEMSIFRIIQGLLNNCIKHSHASVVQVSILNKNKFVKIRVQDNGIGFDFIKQVKLPAGSGLSSIKNRINFFNGAFQVASKAGKGTAITIIFPKPEK